MEQWKADAVALKLIQKMSWDTTTSAVVDKYPAVFAGLTSKQAWEKVRTAVRGSDEYKAMSKAVPIDKKEPTEADVDAYFDALMAVNDAAMRLETKQTKATFDIPDDKPIGIAFWGDWHVGAKGADIRRLNDDVDTIADTDGLYCIGMGDYKDNASALVHAGATQESVSTTDMQSLVVQRLFERVGKKAIAIVRGCHDDWDKRNANVDFVQSLCNITGAVNMWHGGVITLNTGEQQYKIAARHKYKYESSLNTTNAQRNWANDIGPVDVFALAHRHYYDAQQIKRMGQDMVYIRSGAYKYYDEYGQKLAGYEAIYGIPIVICMPDKKSIMPFKSFQDGLKVLDLLRR
jgi:hypothetical protein